MQRRSLRVALVLVAGILSAAAPIASAVPVVFTGVFSAANEVPPNASTATGFAVVTFDIDAATLTIDVSWAGLTTLPTAAHIHCCTPPGANAPVATQTPSFSGFPGLLTGTYFNVFDTTSDSSFSAGFITSSGGTAPQAEANLLANMLAGNTYLNIHTSSFPGGEIRANLAPVPEPATLGLLGAGLLGLMRQARKRRP